MKRLRWQVADLQEELRDQRRRSRERETELQAELRAERESNRQREERLLDRVLTSKDTYPITDPPQRPKPSAETAPLSAMEEAELGKYLAWSIEAGYAPEIGRKMWYAKRAGNPIPPPAPPQNEAWNAFADMEPIQN